MRRRERARSAELANKASKEAKEYALKKKRQKELAKQKRFGNSWGKIPKSTVCKSLTLMVLMLATKRSQETICTPWILAHKIAIVTKANLVMPANIT